MIIHAETIEGTVASGSLSENTNDIRGLCHQVMVKPASETTIYNVSITNSKDVVVYERLSETGTLAELVSIPVRGIYTVAISSSTVDEVFIIQLGIQE